MTPRIRLVMRQEQSYNLRSKIIKLAAKNKELTESVKQIANEKKNLKMKLQQAGRESDILLRQQQAVMPKISLLNELLIRNQKFDNPIDEEIHNRMFKVQNMVQEMINKKKAVSDEVKLFVDIVNQPA